MTKRAPPRNPKPSDAAEATKRLHGKNTSQLYVNPDHGSDASDHPAPAAVLAEDPEFDKGQMENNLIALFSVVLKRLGEGAGFTGLPKVLCSNSQRDDDDEDCRFDSNLFEAEVREMDKCLAQLRTFISYDVITRTFNLIYAFTRGRWIAKRKDLIESHPTLKNASLNVSAVLIVLLLTALVQQKRCDAGLEMDDSSRDEELWVASSFQEVMLMTFGGLYKNLIEPLTFETHVISQQSMGPVEIKNGSVNIWPKSYGNGSLCPVPTQHPPRSNRMDAMPGIVRLAQKACRVFNCRLPNDYLFRGDMTIQGTLREKAKRDATTHEEAIASLTVGVDNPSLTFQFVDFALQTHGEHLKDDDWFCYLPWQAQLNRDSQAEWLPFYGAQGYQGNLKTSEGVPVHILMQRKAKLVFGSGHLGASNTKSLSEFFGFCEHSEANNAKLIEDLRPFCLYAYVDPMCQPKGNQDIPSQPLDVWDSQFKVFYDAMMTCREGLLDAKNNLHEKKAHFAQRKREYEAIGPSRDFSMLPSSIEYRSLLESYPGEHDKRYEHLLKANNAYEDAFATFYNTKNSVEYLRRKLERDHFDLYVFIEMHFKHEQLLKLAVTIEGICDVAFKNFYAEDGYKGDDFFYDRAVSENQSASEAKSLRLQRAVARAFMNWPTFREKSYKTNGERTTRAEFKTTAYPEGAFEPLLWAGGNIAEPFDISDDAGSRHFAGALLRTVAIYVSGGEAVFAADALATLKANRWVPKIFPSPPSTFPIDDVYSKLLPTKPYVGIAKLFEDRKDAVENRYSKTPQGRIDADLSATEGAIRTLISAFKSWGERCPGSKKRMIDRLLESEQSSEPKKAKTEHEKEEDMMNALKEEFYELHCDEEVRAAVEYLLGAVENQASDDDEQAPSSCFDPSVLNKVLEIKAQQDDKQDEQEDRPRQPAKGNTRKMQLEATRQETYALMPHIKRDLEMIEQCFKLLNENVARGSKSMGSVHTIGPTGDYKEFCSTVKTKSPKGVTSDKFTADDVHSDGRLKIPLIGKIEPGCMEQQRKDMKDPSISEGEKLGIRLYQAKIVSHFGCKALRSVCNKDEARIVWGQLRQNPNAIIKLRRPNLSMKRMNTRVLYMCIAKLASYPSTAMLLDDARTRLEESQGLAPTLPISGAAGCSSDPLPDR